MACPPRAGLKNQVSTMPSVDPLAWVRDSDIDFGAGTSTNQAQDSDDEEDPYAWMTGGDISANLDLGTFAPSEPLAVEDNDTGDTPNEVRGSDGAPRAPHAPPRPATW